MSTRSISSKLSISAFAVAAAAFMAPAAHAEVPESNDPIKIALFDWTSVNLNAKILGGILEKLGYTVEYPTADYLSSLVAKADDIDDFAFHRGATFADTRDVDDAPRHGS